MYRKIVIFGRFSRAAKKLMKSGARISLFSSCLFFAFASAAIGQSIPATTVPATTIGATVANIIVSTLLQPDCRIPGFTPQSCQNVIQTQAQVDAFAGVTAYDRSLIISGQGNLDFSPFNSLVEISGSLSFLYGAQSSVVGFNNLERVGFGVEFLNNSGLTSVNGFNSLTHLATFGTNDQTNRSATLTFFQNPNLLQVSGFQNLGFANKINFSGNNTLETIPTFNGLVDVAELDFIDNPALEQISGFINLEEIGGTASSGFTVENNAQLSTVSGFGALTNAASINIDNNQQLDTISGFGSLDIVDRFLWIRFLPSLSELPNFSNLSRVDSLILRGLGSLSQIPGFPDLVTARSIRLNALGLAQNIAGFNGLITVRSLTISDNPVLTTMAGFTNLGEVGDAIPGSLDIVSNPMLESASGFPNLAPAGVNGTVNIYYNDLLDCPGLFGGLEPIDYSTGNAVNCETD
ncbi:MAG: hypothetical protein KTR18_11985 [Acidiferrobacterales bacterium]|nr:hypothetical protein [Acidiferrobacterales bacterium]